MKSRVLNRRQARWSLFLADFNFQIIYRPGSQAILPDTLSRRSDYALKGGDEHVKQQERALINPTSYSEEVHVISTIPIIDGEDEEQCMLPRTLKDIIRSATTEAVIAQFKPENVLNDNFEFRDGLLWLQSKIVVPASAQDAVLKTFHDHMLAGHPGRKKTFEVISKWFWFPKMRSYIEKYVKQCDTCQRTKPIRQVPAGLLQPLDIPHRPWNQIAMDFIVKLPISNGYDSVLTVVDRFSKMAHFIPCRETITAPELSDLLVSEIFKHHGLPDSIVSDRGSVFVSQFWSHVCKSLRIKRGLSTSYHPQTDGQSERTNQILEQYFRCFLSYQQDNWSALLPLAEIAYNSTPQASLGTSPFEAVFGYPLVFQVEDLESYSAPTIKDHIKHIRLNFESLKSELQYAQTRMQHFANANRRNVELDVNQMVWLDSRNIKTTRPSQKLAHRRLGPYKIIERIGKVAYRLELPPDLQSIHPVFHVSLLTPAYSNPNVSIPPGPVIINNEEEFEVSEILDSKQIRRKVKYLVAWKGYGPEHNSWLPIENLDNCPSMLADFHSRYPSKPDGRSVDRP